MADMEYTDAEQRRIAVAEELWLHYFNTALFAKGLIVEYERNRMIHLINSRKSSVKEQK